jgi:hypothetical protein
MDTAGGLIQGVRPRQEDAFAIERIDDGVRLVCERRKRRVAALGSGRWRGLERGVRLFGQDRM